MSSRMAFQVGDRFGKLVILRQDGVHKKPCGTTERRWLCKCDCGNEVSVLGHNLKSGNTKSCGCLPKQSRLPNNRGVINHIILQYPEDSMDAAEKRAKQIMGLGFLPFAMLYRDETGQRDPEWRKFQREWANAVIVGRKFSDFWEGKG